MYNVITKTNQRERYDNEAITNESLLFCLPDIQLIQIYNKKNTEITVICQKRRQ